MRGIVTFTSDFGTRDSYVGQVKGILLSHDPEINVVDLTHDVPKHDILAGARILAEAVPCFPEGTVHLAVVDPGVGSSRRRLVIDGSVRGKRMFFVGPDNGLFSLIELESKQLWEIPAVLSSATFEGRDVFGPAAALLAAGEEPSKFFQPFAGNPVTLETPQPKIVDGIYHGEVTHFDSFGNAITNIPGSATGDFKSVFLADGREIPFAATYEEIPPGELRVLVNSQGFIELAARRKPVSGIAMGASLSLRGTLPLKGGE